MNSSDLLFSLYQESFYCQSLVFLAPIGHNQTWHQRPVKYSAEVYSEIRLRGGDISGDFYARPPLKNAKYFTMMST